MFICPFTRLVLTNAPRAKAKLKGLLFLSEACADQGLLPAQGIRLARRVFKDDYAAIKSTGDPLYAEELAQRIHWTLTVRQDTSLTTAHTQLPDHFLVHTIINNNILTTKGYLSPVLDVQPDVHFIRTQRRFNKRRYARVRASSRPSFWTGMSLSTIATGAFWGSTVQATDWLTTGIIIPDPNFWVLIAAAILSYRAWKLQVYAGTARSREFNRARRGWISQLHLA